jgi:EAL domain-containing protein (putative c-di-GMP-specific phosphodiesterase class I)
MSVNLSAQQFWQRGLVETVTNALAESVLDPSWLELELTEGTIMRSAKATVRAMHLLK